MTPADRGHVTLDTAPLIRPAEDRACVFDRTWHATPTNVARSCRALLASLREEGLAEPTLDAIGAAVTEVATNTVYHAYVGRRIGQFRITATIESDEIKVSVDDDGSGFDEEAAVSEGRGLALIASVAKRIETSSRLGSGTLTTMWFERAH